MGGGVIGLVIALVILVVMACVIFFVIPLARQRQQVSDEINAPETPTLEYELPVGQDPAVVIAGLAGEGYHATVDPTNTQLVRIACPAGVDRERARVRAVIEQVDTTAIDAGRPVDRVVRFRDER